MTKKVSWATLTTAVLNVIMLIMLYFLNPSMYQIGHLSDFIGNTLPLLFVAMGQTLVILTSGVDLSVGPLLSFINVVAASTFIHLGLLGVLIALSISVAAGLLAGITIAYGRLQPIIATLAMSSIWSGAALFVMPQPGGAVPKWYTLWTSGFFGPIPINVVWLGVVFLALYLLLNRSPLAGRILALGNNEQSAFFSGLNPTRLKIFVYAMSGLLTGIGALFLTSMTGSGDPNIGPSYTLNSIAAVVLGGTSLMGGKGSIWKTLNGVLLLQLIVQVIFFLGISSFYQDIVEGSLLILALGINRWFKKSGVKKRGIAHVA